MPRHSTTVSIQIELPVDLTYSRRVHATYKDPAEGGEIEGWTYNTQELKRLVDKEIEDQRDALYDECAEDE
jgi:alpha-D-ribose 1-methylphosphonate 5-triphosphate synthase subunit PhnI